MCDLGLRGKKNLLVFKAELLNQQPGAAILLARGTQHRASGDKLNSILKEEHETTQRSLKTTISRAVRTGHAV